MQGPPGAPGPPGRDGETGTRGKPGRDVSQPILGLVTTSKVTGSASNDLSSIRVCTLLYSTTLSFSKINTQPLFQTFPPAYILHIVR
jgi:hypothetical protein